jgi:hypothetical protein
MQGQEVVSLFAFLYAGQEVDRNEVIKLKGLAGDERLIGLRYFAPFDPSFHQRKKCDMCSRLFANERAYIEHRKKPSCITKQSGSGEPTKADLAQMLDVGYDKLKVEEPSAVIDETLVNTLGLSVRE